MEQALKSLKAIGFSEYEARAYCALLKQSPGNGYQIAKLSGIPRGKIYECIERLIARNAIVQIETPDDSTKLFAPVDATALIDSIEDSIKDACGSARDALDEFTNKKNIVEVLWRVTSQKDLVARGKALTKSAKTSLHVATWDDEFDEFLPLLIDAAKREVKIALVLYGSHKGVKKLQQHNVGAITHSGSKQEAVKIMGRQFVLVADRESCITGSIFPDNNVEGVYTHNRGLVTNAVDLVNHEIYLERILKEVGKPVFDIFGKELVKLDAFDPVRE